ncbi:MAG: UDP-2,4-diacetamido-2,4,6-trideoxy-beta-L-altropyranose hydrolase [Akkermansiaceae bacterium]
MIDQLLIRADANSEIGYGHAMRCLALAQAAHSQGTIIHFVFTDAPQSVIDAYSELGTRFLKIEAPAYSDNDAQVVCNYAKSHSISWIVLDTYLAQPSYVHTLRTEDTNVLCFDDTGMPSSMAADVIVNQNASAKPEWYEDTASHTKTLLGSTFTMLRSEFINPEYCEKKDTILITTGGTDELNCSPRIVDTLLPLLPGSLDCTVIIGSANPHAGLLHKMYDDQPKVKLVENVVNMQPFFSSAQLVFTGAGSSVWECLHLGTPIITMVLAENQRAIAEHLEMLQLSYNAGYVKSEEFLKAISNHFRKFMSEPQKFAQNAVRGKSLIDGRGAFKILESMEQ